MKGYVGVTSHGSVEDHESVQHTSAERINRIELSSKNNQIFTASPLIILQHFFIICIVMNVDGDTVGSSRKRWMQVTVVRGLQTITWHQRQVAEQLVHLDPAVDEEEAGEGGHHPQQLPQTHLHAEHGHGDNEEDDEESEVVDHPVQEIPPLPLDDTKDEQDIDQDSKSHSWQNTSDFQPENILCFNMFYSVNSYV